MQIQARQGHTFTDGRKRCLAMPMMGKILRATLLKTSFLNQEFSVKFPKVRQRIFILETFK